MVDSAAERFSRLGAGGSWGGPGGNLHTNRSWDSPVAGQWGRASALGGLAGGVEFFPPVRVLCYFPTFATRNGRSVCPDCNSNFWLGSS